MKEKRISELLTTWQKDGGCFVSIIWTFPFGVNTKYQKQIQGKLSITKF